MIALLNQSEEVYQSFSQTPERDLLFAILDRCVLDYHGSNQKLKLAAAEWLFEDESGDVDREFSFTWICNFLGFEKEPLRECIRNMDMSDKSPQGHRWLRKKVKSPALTQLSA